MSFLALVNLTGNRKPIFTPPLNNFQNTQPFNFRPPSTKEIENLLKKLPSSFNSRVDGIPAIVLKILSPLIINPLKDIFSLSFEKTKFCKQWKNSVITPLKKISNPKPLSDFRPITKTSSLK